MILLITVCSHELHTLEFVKPIEDILKREGISSLTKHYLEISPIDLERADKIIICGTSLADNLFVGHIDSFSWIKTCNKPVLGICAGFQIIGLVYGLTFEEKREIGYFYEDFEEDFLGLSGEQQVYHLHNNYVDFSSHPDFDVLNDGTISQAIKHKIKNLYGVLFHPEVRQKDMVVRFALL